MDVGRQNAMELATPEAFKVTVLVFPPLKDVTDVANAGGPLARLAILCAPFASPPRLLLG